MEASERRFQIIWLLCRRRHETMKNMSREFGVSVRTIRRDINIIGNTIPIYIQYGRYNGGVYLMDHYCMDKLYMTESELDLLRRLRAVCTSSFDQHDQELLDHIIHQYAKPRRTDYEPCEQQHGHSSPSQFAD